MRIASHEETERDKQSDSVLCRQESVSQDDEKESEAEGPSEENGAASGLDSGVDTERTDFALTFRDQIVVAAVAGVTIVVCSFFYFSKGHIEPASARLSASLPAARWEIDINSADWRELTVLRGVGPSLARQIIQDRKTNGPFDSVEDLQRVPGIGPRTVQKNRHRLRAASQEKTSRPEKPRNNPVQSAE
jgi:competence protein ComEA